MDTPYQAIDLFGGIGGFRLGIQQSNLQADFIDYYDNNKHAVKSYNAIFNENHDPTNIRDVDADDIPRHDILCAGFPCQSFSIAGKRGGFKDTRGTLFFEVARIARRKLPQILLLENVKGLLNHANGKTFRTILSTLHELGYTVEWQVLNSKYHGVPQNRNRLFIVGHLRGQPRRKIFPFAEQEGRNTGQDERNNVTGEMETIVPNQPQIGQAERVYQTHGISPALNVGWTPKVCGTEKDLDNVDTIRQLTPKECWRLQGFPDWAYNRAKEVNNEPQLYHQAGNAVTVNVVKDIANRLHSTY